jgi:transposase InsO family protein
MVRNTCWARNPIDRFILARLEAEGLSPSPEADKATLLRRLSLDLTGLPPSVEEVDAFVADTSQDAWTTAVDRLLASPHNRKRIHSSLGYLTPAEFEQQWMSMQRSQEPVETFVQ